MTRTYRTQGRVGRLRGKVSRKTKETMIGVKMVMSLFIGCVVGYAAGYSHLKFW